METRKICRDITISVYSLLTALLVSSLILPSSAWAAVFPDNLWSYRQNREDRFHDNDSIIRPWRSAVDDGVGQWVGNHSYEIPWTYDGLVGNGTGGVFLPGEENLQFNLWTYVYLEKGGDVTVTGDGDCVLRLYWDYQFDSPHELPWTETLTAGWHRADITGYNQNDTYNANILAPTGATYINHEVLEVPEPATGAIAAIGLLALAARRRQG